MPGPTSNAAVYACGDAVATSPQLSPIATYEGRTGEARPSLLRLLREAPSAAVIDSITAVADEECLVILGRIARTRPDLADAALAALDSIGSSRAVKIAAASRQSLPRSATSSPP